MAYVLLVLLCVVAGWLGYRYGAIRIGLALSPLLMASILLWLFGPLMYSLSFLRNLGLVWPGLFLVVLGLGCGAALQLWSKKKLSKEIHRNDRIGGASVGVVLACAVGWTLCIWWVLASVEPGAGSRAGSTLGLARGLNSGVVQWIPGVGAGADRMMDLVDIAAADEETRSRVLVEMEFDTLYDLPQMRAVMEDERTRRDVESAGAGSIGALWRLQQNALILELFDSPQMKDLLDRHTLESIAESVRDEETRQHEDG